jgi:hypothetical protein
MRDEPSLPQIGTTRADGARSRRLSELLHDVAQAPNGVYVTLSEIRDVLGERAFGPLMLVFAAPNLIPNPIPGISAILGLPLLFLTVQLMLGAPRPWLPAWLGNRGMQRAGFGRMVERAGPWLERAEKLLRPRVFWLLSPAMERVIGAVALLLAAVLFLPIFLGNWLPALSLCLLALGILERDGMAVALGLVTAVVAVVVVAGVVFALVKAGLFAAAHIFSR